MMKKSLLLAIATMLLPLSMMAQGYHMVEKDGLEYICKDGDPEDDEHLFIYVGSYDYWTTTGDETGTRILVTDLEGNDIEIQNNRYFHHGTFRSQMRSKYNNDAPDPQLFAKKKFKAVTSINFTWARISDYKGIEYFRGIKSLEIKSNGDSTDPLPYGIYLDLSKNADLTSLTFNQTRLGKLDISGTKITSLTIPTTSSGTLRELIMNDNEDLTSLTFSGTTAFSELKTLDLSHTGVTTFSGQYLTALETLTAQNSALTSLDISYCTGLVTLDVSGSSSLTTLTVASSNQSKLEEINVSGTGLTSLDLSKYIGLEEVIITTGQFGSGTPPANITLPTAGGQSWSKVQVHGSTETWVNVAGIHTLTWDVSDQANKDVDLSAYTSLHTLTLIGAESVILPSTSNTTNHFTLTMTDCADATIDWNGRETVLTELTLNDVESFDGSSFTNLVTLRHMGSQSENLTLSSANTALETLDITNGGQTTLDLSGGEAPNLVTMKTWHSALEYLDLSYHTRLVSAPYPSHENLDPSTTKVYIKDGAYVPYSTVEANPSAYAAYQVTDPNQWIGLNLLPVTKSQHDWFDINTDEHFDHSITNIATFNANNNLTNIILKGCTGLTDTYLTHGADDTDESAANDQWMYYNKLETVDLSDCTGLTGIHATNTLLTTLNLDGCSSLEDISIDQGLLAGKAASAGAPGIWIDGCDNIKIFMGNRQQFADLDFLLKPNGSRDAADIAKIQEIHASGGSYTIKDAEGAPIVREDGSGNKIKITNRISEIDLSNLVCWDGNLSHNGLRKLIIDCNLLEQLDLNTNNIGRGLQQLVCSNNMITTLDLSSLTEAVKNGLLNLNACDWKYQVSYAGAEVVKGQWDKANNTWMTFDTAEEEAAESGKHDWVALHMEYGGFTHHMDNTLALYRNLHDARWDEEQGVNPSESTRRLAKEADSWMCRVDEVESIVSKELEGYEKFVGDNPCPSGHQSYQHIFLHSQNEITTDFGAFKDQDLTGCVLSYQYNTGFLQDHVTNVVTDQYNVDPGAGDLHYSLQKYASADFDYTISNYYDAADKINVKKDAETEYTSDELIDMGHIYVRVHLYPHLLNINPASKSPMSVRQKQVDYFSSTLMLDYDALIPQGVTCYTISGVNEKSVFEVAGKALDGQLNMVPFGGEDDPDGNWILPANTPVYVRSVSPQPAGLYAFQPIHEVNILGWENVRGAYNQPDFMLHGIDNLNAGGVKTDYAAALEAAKDRLKSGGKNEGNILEGFVATKYDVDIYDENYNNVIPGAGTEYLQVTARTILALGVQNQKSTWPVIGFWPYNGTKMQSNRCFIRTRYVYPEGTTTAKGFNFFFVGEEESFGDATGIKTLNNDADAQQGWYNMQGVRLNKRPTQHGVYIYNGKKVTIK